MTNDGALTRAAGTRVAVTGLGVKTPAGNDLDTFWSRLLCGPLDRGDDRAVRPVADCPFASGARCTTSIRPRTSGRRKLAASTG